ncbi:MAG: histidine phosphatase family protein [Pseudomonadota bacterium]
MTALPPAQADNSKQHLWRALKSGEAFAIMRHALAPGTGDPQTVVIGDCTTQRNLSERGRQQAREIGALFRRNGITSARVATSQWCRCRETARLLDIGDVEDLPSLNSFFTRRERADAQTATLKTWLAQRAPNTPHILVTHQVNINALTGRFTRSGETLVVRRTPDGDYDVLGSILE